MELEVINKHLTPELVKHNHVTELMKLNITLDALREMERNLIYNEDGLPQIIEFENKLKKALNVVDAEYEKEKKPIREQGKVVDAGRNLIYNPINKIFENLKINKTTLCEAIDKRKKEADEAKEKKDQQRRDTDNAILNLSEKLAAATTIEQLRGIENILNLQTANTSKYGEYLEELKTRCVPIRKLIGERKETIKAKLDLDIKEQEATKKGDDEHLEAILDQKQGLEDILFENSTKIQETASSQSLNSVSRSEQVFASAPVKRRTKEWEVVDLQLLFKKRPDLIDLVPNKEKIDEILKKDVENGIFGKDADYVTFGIRFFEKKIYA